MADFKTHMTVSTATGGLLALAGVQAKLPWDTCVVAATLCSVSGMLPDLDSNSGRPLREATALGAAVVPMLMVDRLQRLDLKPDTMVLIAILTYVAIRFVLAEIFRRYTVHRGMWHSIPAAAICGMVAFLVMSNEDIRIRLFKTSGVVLGFLSHLILDEIWSVDFKKGSYRFKDSFGTALKLWGGNRPANIFTYVKLLIIGVFVWQDQGFMSKYHIDPNVPHTVTEMIASLRNGLQSLPQVGEKLQQMLPSELESELSNSFVNTPLTPDSPSSSVNGGQLEQSVGGFNAAPAPTFNPGATSPPAFQGYASPGTTAPSQSGSPTLPAWQ